MSFRGRSVLRSGTNVSTTRQGRWVVPYSAVAAGSCEVAGDNACVFDAFAGALGGAER